MSERVSEWDEVTSNENMGRQVTQLSLASSSLSPYLLATCVYISLLWALCGLCCAHYYARGSLATRLADSGAVLAPRYLPQVQIGQEDDCRW